MIILASASPRRIEMLKNAGYDPVVKPASIMESLPFEMTPEASVMYLALAKASAVTEKLLSDYENGSPDLLQLQSAPQQPEMVIIAADTVVAYAGSIIGKPADKNEARSILGSLSGKSHHVITGCCIIKCACEQAVISVTSRECFYEDTEVFFSRYSVEELEEYLETDEPYDKAGGYAIQGYFSRYIEHIDGDYDNVVGLPLQKVIRRI